MHINNICERNYAQVDGPSRMLVPTKLGIALVHGYRIYQPLSLSKVTRQD